MFASDCWLARITPYLKNGCRRSEHLVPAAAATHDRCCNESGFLAVGDQHRLIADRVPSISLQPAPGGCHTKCTKCGPNQNCGRLRDGGGDDGQGDRVKEWIASGNQELLPEPGIRLIRQDDLGAFDVQMTTLRAELDEGVARLDEHYSELKLAARRLGALFNPADYPPSLVGLFAVEWDFPSIEPPSYLRQLSPELYRQEQARMTARFDEAVRLAEEAFTSELGQLVSHLSERLTGQQDGKPKVFRDSAIGNLLEFFERFRQLNVGSSEQLDGLVDQRIRHSCVMPCRTCLPCVR
jgi:hypothetical protein